MGSLRDWWDRMLGRSPPAPPPVKRRAPPQNPKPAATLEIADTPATREPVHPGSAGFDSYGNDAGYTKPHSWERVDHD
jgi:hypothetical protein